MNKYQRQKARYYGKPVPPGLKHGISSYPATVYGCTCGTCRQPRLGKQSWTDRNYEDRALTHAERQKRLRESKRGTPVPPGLKHGTYAYVVYACRCPTCVAAKDAERARRAARREKAWRSAARGRWTSDGTMDSICWPPSDAGPDWVCPGCTNKEVA